MDASPKFTIRLASKPIIVIRAELDWARTHPLALFDRMLLEIADAHRRAGRGE